MGASQHIGWAKLHAIAPVLNKQNANQWINVASNQVLKEVSKLVEQHQFNPFGAAVGDLTATKVETFEWQDGQTDPITAAFVGLDPEAVAKTFADVLNNLDNQTANAILKSMCAMVTCGGTMHAMMFD